MKIQLRLFCVAAVLFQLVACGKEESPPANQLTLEWSTPAERWRAQTVSLVANPDGQTGHYKATEPVKVRYPISGSATFTIDLAGTQLPTREFSKLRCTFKTVESKPRELGTGIGTPFPFEVFSEAKGNAKIRFTLDWLENSIDQIKPGRSFDVLVTLETLEVSLPIMITE